MRSWKIAGLWPGKPVCERRGGRVVYRGGLENRFGRKPNGGSNPSLSARRIVVNNLTEILIWAAVIVAIFGFLWWQGHIRRISIYWQETVEELKKCSWPTWTELKGSTAVIFLTIVMLGAFVIAIDEVFFNVFFKFLK
jgi:preprotein translocase subunit SecE